ncbi:hypothetical protein [Collimonas fungivorans]|uniref:hypothetical protein n=1 Tax=Collimonas fungivorans TaxID=158899 RepID=UPI003FA3BE48
MKEHPRSHHEQLVLFADDNAPDAVHQSPALVAPQVEANREAAPVFSFSQAKRLKEIGHQEYLTKRILSLIGH